MSARRPRTWLKREVNEKLDAFREGVAVLRSPDGKVAGHLATTVEPFWSPGHPLTVQERVWFLVTWSDGTRRRIEEDYPPWTLVTEVHGGGISLDHGPGTEEERFTATWLSGPARDRAWTEFGIAGDGVT